ncbi:MAG: hypothetical protein RL417_652 [Pseudomonadota bacterium]|jgi:hypothetical protein
MKTKIFAILLVVLVGSLCAAPSVEAQSSWRGTSTNMAGNFNYGPVSFKVRSGFVRNFLVEGVTTSGCGGYKSVIVPKIKIRGRTFKGTYRPIPGIDDVIRVNGKFDSKFKRASGTFSEGPLCVNAGKFSARKR